MWLSTKLTLTKSGRTEKVKEPVSNYQPEGLERERIAMIRDDFTSGDVLQRKPRREFNDISFIDRLSIDQMAWAVYQPNDGDGWQGDEISGWRSNAVRPIVRNKVFSIAAHVSARMLFPKLIAFDKDSSEQAEAAQVMSDLMEYSVLHTNSAFADVSLKAVIAALVNPVSIVQTQYRETFRTVKRGKKGEDGKYKTEEILDDDQSGFMDESVPPEQIFIQDYFQPDIQRQGFVIRRRVRPYTTMRSLYGDYDNFVYVQPGIQCIYNDANVQFYDAYDPELATDECEEVLYWNKHLDLFLVAVNGILLTDADNPNPREDKLYPFLSFGYEYLRPQGDSFYWKSLAFKTMPDDKIVNTLYPMIIDGTYLAIMPPMVNIGGEIIESDVIVPGGVTTFSNPDADLKPLVVQSENLKAGMDALFKVEENINDDAFNKIQNGELPDGGGNMPAYNMSVLERNQKLLLGPFVDMVARYVKQFARLRIGDITQYLTMPEVSLIEGSANADLIYKTFILPQGKSRSKTKKIEFSLDMPDDEMLESDYKKSSYDLLDKEQDKVSLAQVNPTLFRSLRYLAFVGTDVLAPMSEELEAQWGLEAYDKMIAAPGLFDPEETANLFLESMPSTKRHPKKYLAKAAPQNMAAPALSPSVDDSVLQSM